MDKKKKKKTGMIIDETLPHQISSPVFKGSGIRMQEPFINEFGVEIGDSFYNSANSPLNTWSKDTDPSIMSGDEWVHPTNDIGWNSTENKELIEQKKRSKGQFMHPPADVSYDKD